MEGARISHNWAHDSPKAGFRFDSSPGRLMMVTMMRMVMMMMMVMMKRRRRMRMVTVSWKVGARWLPGLQCSLEHRHWVHVEGGQAHGRAQPWS